MKDRVEQDELNFDHRGSLYPQPKSIFFEADDTGYVEIPAEVQKWLDADLTLENK